MMSHECEPTRLTIGKREQRRDGRTEAHQFETLVPPELRWFRGHFDGHPVLPAMVQLHEVLQLAATIWPDLAGLRRISRAKFRRPIRPGDQLSLRLTRTLGTRKMSFEYLRSGICCSSGILEFATGDTDGR